MKKMNKKYYILIQHNIIDSQDTSRNLSIADILLFKSEKDSKDFIKQKYKATNWHEYSNTHHVIEICSDPKNKPMNYTVFHLYERDLLNKSTITEMLTKKLNYCF